MRQLYNCLKVKKATYARYASTLGKGFDITNEMSVERTRVTGYGDYAFSVNDVLIRNSVILLPSSYFLWNARQFSDITVHSLAVFPLLVPTIEVLLLGCGESLPHRISPEIIQYFKSKGIYVEATNSGSAASTFNVLNGEDRVVAAAILTLKPNLKQNDDGASSREFFLK